ncbi:MAG: AI-2E family transporter [Ruminococcus flavefaciens]|nr:AI-2E family transporter [Ruminococcus flavefaciens]MCM1360697.1 AI-2E family transporter [Clostridiales bacterium]MCM1435294.1 AI-2E family transporter [Ruminococcus flavefaciens]
MDKQEIKRGVFVAALAVAVCVIVQNFSYVQGLARIALKALEPLFIGCIMAYIFNIIMNFFEKHYFPKKNNKFINGSRRPLCLLFSFAITIAIIVLVLNIIIPEIINAIKLMYSVIPPLFIKCRDWAMVKLEEYPDIQKEINNIELDTASIAEKVTDHAFGLFNSVISLIGTITATVTNLILGIIFAIYLLLRKDKLKEDLNRFQNLFISDKINKKINRFFSVAHETFTNFFIGQFIEAIIIGTLTFIGASILRLPYAAMTGTIVGVTALIPIVGAFVGAALSAFIIFTESPKQALIFLIFLIILQQFETNIIYPKVVGSSIGLPGIWVLASVTLGGGLCGIMGMMLGVPLAATLYKLYFETIEQKEGRLLLDTDSNNEKKAAKPDSSPAKQTKIQKNI